tara:strand:- start:9220 stop:11463 length:2244 start_codon:yes stop_codon:yes gene_type:complete
MPVALQDEPSFERHVSPVLSAHCAECHGGEDPAAGYDLGALGGPDELDAFDWDLIREVVQSGEMPPLGSSRPEAKAQARFLAWIDARVPGEFADEVAGEIDPGPAPLRRLNGREITRALHDVLGVELDATKILGPDPVGHGFDTAAGALALPAERVEHMLSLADLAATMVFPHDDPRLPHVQHFGPEAFESGGHRGDAAVLSTTSTATFGLWAPRTGRYALTVQLSASRAGDELAKARLKVDARRVGEEREIEAEPGATQTERWEFEMEGGARTLAVRFTNDHYDPQNANPKLRDRNLFVYGATLEGPLDAAQESDVHLALRTRAAERGDASARAQLELLGRRLWRRPLQSVELDRLLALTQDADPEALRMQVGAVALLASPHFHLRVEAVRVEDVRDAGTTRLGGFELATRLALFLWSSVPDEALLDAAAAGRLDDDAGLAAQVERMLTDPRARILAESFGLAWLGVPALEQHRPDPDAFPGWNFNVGRSSVEETRRVLEELLFEDRPLTDLVAADWTWVDSRLARLYGLKAVPRGQWQRVSLTDTPRRGVLGHASLLTVTSNPARTSIPRRGKWVLEALLGTPPPDPPPGADSLDDSSAESGLSLRQRLELHRADPDCRVCHVALDPIGFGMEAFDGIGRARSGAEAEGLDTTGELPDGRTFAGPVQLAEILANEPRLPRQIVERMLVFALGRGIERSDRPAIDAILDELDPERPTFGQALRAVCASPLLTHARGRTLAGQDQDR